MIRRIHVEEGLTIELTARQLEIVELIKRHEPITGEQLSELLGVSRPTIRSDLSILVMLGMIDAKPKVGYFLGASSSSAAVKSSLRVMKVKDVQSIPVIVRETSSVQDAVATLFLENVGSLFVVNESGELSGVVSRKDLLKATLGNANAGAMPVSFVMTRVPNIVTVQPEDTVIAAAQKMIKHEVDSLPVVRSSINEKAQIVGRVTKTTMTRVLVEWGTES